MLTARAAGWNTNGTIASGGFNSQQLQDMASLKVKLG